MFAKARVNTSLAILRVPDAPEAPAPLRGRVVAHVRFCHVGTATDPVRGYIYVSDSPGAANATIYRFNASTITASSRAGVA